MKTICRLLCFFALNIAVADLIALNCAVAQNTTLEKITVDRKGRKLLFDKTFHKIISLYGAHTENLFSLGLEQSIIGVSKNDNYPPAALRKKKYSYRDDSEKFLAARPDLVLIRPMIDKISKALIARLEKSNIVVVSLQPRTTERMFSYWLTLGRLTGKTDEAEKMTACFKQGIAFFTKLNLSIKKRKKVYFASIHRKMKTFAPESMSIFALQMAGGINIAKDARTLRKSNIAAYSKEKILSHANEIEVFFSQYGPMNHASIEEINREPGFKVIKAVKNKQIYIIDEKLVSRPTLRLLQGIWQIGSKLYPEIYNAEKQEKLNFILKNNNLFSSLLKRKIILH